MVPIFVNQSNSILDEDKLRANIEKGREIIAPRGEMSALISHDALASSSLTGLNSSTPRRLGGAPCKRREVTGKVGTPSDVAKVINENSAQPHSNVIGQSNSINACDEPQPLNAVGARACIGGSGLSDHDIVARRASKLDERLQTPWRWSDAGSGAPTTPLDKTLADAQAWGLSQSALEPLGEIPVLTTALKLGVGFAGGKGSRARRGGHNALSQPWHSCRLPKAPARKAFPTKKDCSLPTDPVIRSARDKAPVRATAVVSALPQQSQSARGAAPSLPLSRRLEKPRT